MAGEVRMGLSYDKKKSSVIKPNGYESSMKFNLEII